MKLNEQEIELEYRSKGKIIAIKKGNSGQVYIVAQNAIPPKVAYKTYQVKLNQDEEKHFLEECETWLLIQNTYLLSPYYAEIINKQPYITMPYCDNDLQTVILNNNLNDIEALVLSCQITKALIEMRKVGVKHHQDFNPPNILLNILSNKYSGYTKDNHVKYRVLISDFGIANLREKVGPTIGGEGGKFPFKAPEQYEPKKYDEYEPDIFALGVIIFLLFTGKHPNGMPKDKALKRSTSGSKFKKWALAETKTIDCANEELRTIISKTLELNPKDRPDLKEIFEVLLNELKRKDEFTSINLDYFFKHSDAFNSHNKHITKLDTFNKLFKIEKYQDFVLEKTYKWFKSKRKNINNEIDVIVTCDIFKYLLWFNKKINKLTTDILDEDISFIIKLIEKWADKLKVSHQHPSAKIKAHPNYLFENGKEYIEIISTPNYLRDYEVPADYIGIIIDYLIDLKGDKYCFDLFENLDNKLLQSIYYFHYAEKYRNTDIYKTIELLNTAKSLLKTEAIFDYMEYLWIRMYMIAFDVLKRKGDKKELIKIANKALKKARDKAPEWKKLKSENKLSIKQYM